MSEDKDYLSLPLRSLLADVGAKSPTPGGGSAAAVVGALGAALARMAVGYTVGKEAYAAHEPRLRALLDELAEMSESFAAQMADDMAAYREYAALSRSEVDARQRALTRAIDVPMQIVALAEVLGERLDAIKAITNVHLLSDLQAACELALAAARAAATSARANLARLEDRGQAERSAEALEQSLERLARCRDAVVGYAPTL